MKIKKIAIKNFRSIKEAEISPTGFNVFVGQNNHGKTNLFEALEWFYDGPKKGQEPASLIFLKQAGEEMYVEVEFEGALEGAGRMKNSTNQTKMTGVLDGNDTIIVKRSSLDPKKRTITVAGKLIDKLPTGFDSAFNDFLPKFEYVDTKKYVEDVAKFSRGTPVSIMLSGVLSTILEGSQQYRDFQQKFDELFRSEKSDIKIELDKLSHKVKVYLERQFPDCTKVTFEVTPPVFEDLLKNFDTSVDDGIETSASEKGDGMQRALMLSILQAYSDFRKENEDVGKSFLFFIDEAELHLHPTAQRNLKDVLLDIASRGDQVFINTHSSVLVVDDAHDQTIFRVEKIDRQTEVLPLSHREKAAVVYDLLGGTPTDLLLPRNFLIVEGKSEVTFLNAVITKYYSDKPEIQVIPACGDLDQAARSINAIEQVFKPLEKSLYKDRVVILADKPNKQETLEQFLNNHASLKRNSQVFPLPVSSLEEYYPDRDGWKKTAEEVSAMDGHKKVQLAKRVAAGITQEEFETVTLQIFTALSKCWDGAF